MNDYAWLLNGPHATLATTRPPITGPLTSMPDTAWWSTSSTASIDASSSFASCISVEPGSRPLQLLVAPEATPDEPQPLRSARRPQGAAPKHT